MDRVVTDFRSERIGLGQAFVCPPPALTPRKTRNEIVQENRNLKQRVLTHWLQYTLDRFVGKKILHRFIKSRQERLMARIVKELRSQCSSIVGSAITLQDIEQRRHEDLAAMRERK